MERPEQCQDGEQEEKGATEDEISWMHHLTEQP